MEHTDALIKISENAAKEYAIELLLSKMKREWAHNRLELAAYKTTGNVILFIML